MKRDRLTNIFIILLVMTTLLQVVLIGMQADAIRVLEEENSLLSESLGLCIGINDTYVYHLGTAISDIKVLSETQDMIMDAANRWGTELTVCLQREINRTMP